MFYIFHCEWLANASRKHFFSTTSCFIYFFCGVEKFFVLSDCFIIFLFDHFLIFCFAKDVTAQNILGGKVINQNMICMLIFKSLLKNYMLVKHDYLFVHFSKGYLALVRFRSYDDFFVLV
eukprot:UN21700